MYFAHSKWKAFCWQSLFRFHSHVQFCTFARTLCTGLCETTVEPESTTDPRPTTEVETTTATTTRTTSTSPPGGEAPRITGSVILTTMSFGFLCFIKWIFVWNTSASTMMNIGRSTIVGKMFSRFRINKEKLNINQDIQYDNIPALHRKKRL